MAPPLVLRSRLHAPLLGALLLGILAGCVAQYEPDPPKYPPATLDSTQIHSARSLLAAARVERAADNMPAAERLLYGLLEVHPYYAGAYKELVELQLEVGNLSRAREALDEGLAVDPGNRELQRLEGAYYLASGDLDHALERYEALAQEDKLNAKAQVSLALVQVMRGEDAEALATLAEPFGPVRAKERLAALQGLRERSGQVPNWAPRPVAIVEPDEPKEMAEPVEPMTPIEPMGAEPAPEADQVASAAEILERLDAAREEPVVDGTAVEEAMESAGMDPVAVGPDVGPDVEPAVEPGMEEPVVQDFEPLAAEPEIEEPVTQDVPAEEPAEQDPAEALAQEPLDLEPIELGDPSTAPLGTAKLDAPPVVAPVEPALDQDDKEGEVVVLAVPEEPEEPAVPFVSSEWRGLAKSKVRAYGVLAVQEGPNIEVRMLPQGAHIVTVDPYAAGPVWVMGPKSDWLLKPNARMRFSGDGSVFAGSGDREEFPVPAGRAMPEEVWR